MMTAKTSYRHRKLVQTQQWGRRDREIAMEFDAEKVLVGPPRIHHTEAVELILQYTDERERALRSALTLMAMDLASVYNFIDLMLAHREVSGTYARGQQIVVERLQEQLSRDLKELYNTWPNRAFIDDDVFDVGEPPF